MRKWFVIALIIVLITSVSSELYVKKNWPTYFPKPNYNLPDQKKDSLKIAYGRLLFFDPILSRDNSISCASCHSPYNAFAHTDHDLSHGIGDSIGKRNAPPLFNLAWQNQFMWDGAVNHIDMQALAPIESKSEMGEKLSNVISKINDQKFYRIKTFDLYGDSILQGAQLLKLLTTFQLTLVSFNSKYDRVIRKETTFSDQEEKGYALFKINCNSCHTEPLFSSFKFERNFLAIDTTLNDYGRFEISKNPTDSFKFKVPSLRNLSYSFPYTHDGRFATLFEMLSHYSSEKTQQKFELNGYHPIELSEKEKIDLIAFLLTINDKEFVFNPKNQFPKELLKKKAG